MKHSCHLPGCDRPTPPRHLMCKTHWSMVPGPIQDEVYATVKQRGPNVDSTWAPWWRAQALAIDAVLREVHKDSPRMLENADRLYEREMKFVKKLERRRD